MFFHLNLRQSYAFSNYFNLNLETEDVLAAFGYTFARTSLKIPQSNLDFSDVDQLSLGIQRRLPFVSLSSEIACREILIAPIY